MSMSILRYTLDDRPFRSASARIDLRKPHSAEKRVAVMPKLCAFRQLLQLLGVAAPEHDVISDKRFPDLCDRVHHLAFPFFFAELAHAWLSQKIFDDSVIAIRQVAQFQRQHHVAQNQGRAEPSAESKKQHPAATVTAERLHRGVVDDSDRFTQRFFEIESDPPLSKMFGLVQNSAIADRRRKSDRDHIELPLFDFFFHPGDHFPWSQLRSRFE